MIEYQIILKVYVPAHGGCTIKKIINSSDRDAAITKFKYIGSLVTDKKKTNELKEWCQDNGIEGTIIGTEGLYGVSYIKILP